MSFHFILQVLKHLIFFHISSICWYSSHCGTVKYVDFFFCLFYLPDTFVLYCYLKTVCSSFWYMLVEWSHYTGTEQRSYDSFCMIQQSTFISCLYCPIASFRETSLYQLFMCPQYFFFPSSYNMVYDRTTVICVRMYLTSLQYSIYMFQFYDWNNSKCCLMVKTLSSVAD